MTKRSDEPDFAIPTLHVCHCGALILAKQYFDANGVPMGEGATSLGACGRPDKCYVDKADGMFSEDELRHILDEDGAIYALIE